MFFFLKSSAVQITESGYEEFITPLGHYLQCESWVMIDDVSLNFTEIETMQPFATSEDPGKGMTPALYKIDRLTILLTVTKKEISHQSLSTFL